MSNKNIRSNAHAVFSLSDSHAAINDIDFGSNRLRRLYGTDKLTRQYSDICERFGPSALRAGTARTIMSSYKQPFWLRATFLIGVSLLFTHELDAMTHSEWLVLPLTSWLEPEIGRVIFVSMHVPIFALVLGWLSSRVPGRVIAAQLWVSVFLVMHAVLHLAFSNQPAYTFDGVLSNSLIFGSAICGATYLCFWQKERNCRKASSEILEE